MASSVISGILNSLTRSLSLVIPDLCDCRAKSKFKLGDNMKDLGLMSGLDMRIVTCTGQGWKTYADVGGVLPPIDWASNSFVDNYWFDAGIIPKPNPPKLQFKPEQANTQNYSLRQAQFMWYAPRDTEKPRFPGISDAYFRKGFFLPVQAESLPLEAIARIEFDDDFEFYINGHSVFLNQDQGFADRVFNINFSRYLLQNQRNVIAIHTISAGKANTRCSACPGVLIDARISSVVEPKQAGFFGAEASC